MSVHSVYEKCHENRKKDWTSSIPSHHARITRRRHDLPNMTWPFFTMVRDNHLLYDLVGVVHSCNNLQRVKTHVRGWAVHFWEWFVYLHAGGISLTILSTSESKRVPNVLVQTSMSKSGTWEEPQALFASPSEARGTHWHCRLCLRYEVTANGWTDRNIFDEKQDAAEKKQVLMFSFHFENVSFFRYLYVSVSIVHKLVCSDGIIICCL